MKTFIAVFVLFNVVYTSPVAKTDIPTNSLLIYKTSTGQYEIEDLTREIDITTPQESDIKFYFHSRNGPIDGTEVHTDDSEGIQTAGFSKEKPTLFIVHGWKNEFDSPVIETVSQAALGGQDINVFGVDWGNIARKTYLEASSAVPEVGRLLGKLMESLVANNGLDLATTTVAGHSLGAHVAGKACANIGSKCNVIVGMDPAAPLFSYDKTDNRLDTSDGEFVHVIHTNAGLLGFVEPIGHADYFPNGGSKQPGCILDITGSCCHARSYLYYAESLEKGKFAARKCDNYKDYDSGKCEDQPESFLGQYQVDRSAEGSYYLKTHSTSPYAI